MAPARANREAGGLRPTSRWVGAAFIVLLAASLNWGFFLGDLSDPVQHHPVMLWAAVAAGLSATAYTLRTRAGIKSLPVAVRLVADVQLVAALLVFQLARPASGELGAHATATAVSLSGGALLANLVAVTLLVILALQSDLDDAVAS